MREILSFGFEACDGCGEMEDVRGGCVEVVPWRQVVRRRLWRRSRFITRSGGRGSVSGADSRHRRTRNLPRGDSCCNCSCRSAEASMLWFEGRLELIRSKLGC